MRVIDDPNGWKAGRNKGLANSCDTLIRTGKLYADYAREIAASSFK